VTLLEAKAKREARHAAVCALVTQTRVHRENETPQEAYDTTLSRKVEKMKSQSAFSLHSGSSTILAPVCSPLETERTWGQPLTVAGELNDAEPMKE
jgi:hypothetical protein